MKRYNHIQTLTTLIAAAMLVAGCTKSGDNGGNGGNEPAVPAPMEVRVEVAPRSRSVVTGTEFAHSSRINIILHDAGATTKYQGISQPYEFQKPDDNNPGVWVPTATDGLLVSDPADVYAHSPADLPAYATLDADSKNLDVTLPAELDFGNIQSSSAFESFYLKLRATDTDPTEIFACRDDVDLLTGIGSQVTTAQGGTKQTTIAMKHSLAMVVVYIKRAQGITERPDVQGIAIRNAATGASPLKQGSFALADNAFTPNATDAGYKRTMTGFPIDVVHYAMLVNPATMAAGDAEMVLTADATDYTMPMPAKEWKSGYVYIYNVTISANEAQIGEVVLTDWPAWTEKPFELD